MPRKTPRNDLNDLTGTEWIKATRTWFVCDSPRYHRNKDTELHPARFPEEMVAEFLRFFTKAGGWVLDPFAGSGATLISCSEEGRRGVGVELSARYAEIMRLRTGLMLPPQIALQGDARRLTEPGFWATVGRTLLSDHNNEAGVGRTLLSDHNDETGDGRTGVSALPFADGLPVFDFSISSPPYGQMLRTSRGGVYSKQKARADREDLDTHYSDDPADLGNIPDHDAFVAELARVYAGVGRLLKPDGYLVIVIQNYRAPSGEVVPLAFELALALSHHLLFQGERIWCQNTKPLGIWGYPSTFVPNYHHHYCLIFRKR